MQRRTQGIRNFAASDGVANLFNLEPMHPCASATTSSSLRNATAVSWNVYTILSVPSVQQDSRQAMNYVHTANSQPETSE